AFYNHTFLEKKFETEIMPMYSFGDKGITGIANMSLNLHPDKLFSSISVQLKARRFAYEKDVFTNYYTKIAPGINFEFKKKNLTSPFSHKLGYRYVNILKEFSNYSTDPALPVQNLPFRDNFTY